MKHHVIISGTGRSGTTFLVQLLTGLGLDTGFASPWEGIHANCNAGMEYDGRNPDAPYIIKSPWLCDYIGEVLQRGDIVIDHALIPVRDLYAAAESRRFVSRKAESTDQLTDEVPGGLWHTSIPEQQEAVLTEEFYRLVHELVKYDVPLTFLHFPRLATDAAYLYNKLKTVFQLGDEGKFTRIFGEISNPGLIHDFVKP